MAENQTTEFKMIPIDALYRNPSNPRGNVRQDEVNDLMESIHQYGILQPLIVQSNGEIIAGERRYVAALNLGLEAVPAIIRDAATASESEEIALVENVQRENLLPSVEAKAYARMKARGMTVQNIAEKMNISATKVQLLIQMSALPIEAQVAVDEGRLSLASIRDIYSLKDTEKQHSIIRKAEAGHGLTTSEVREMARSNHTPRAGKPLYSILVNRAIDKIEEARLLLERFDEFKYEREDLADVKQELHSQNEKLLRIEEDIVNAMAEKLTSKGSKVITDDFVKTDYTQQFSASI